MRPFVIALVIAGITALLAYRFPYILQNHEDILHVLYAGLLLLIITFRNRLIREVRASRAAGYAVAWGGIFFLIVFAYSFRDADFMRRIRHELRPQQAESISGGRIEIHASEGGHFFVEAEVNGVESRFMIDTGASDIVLSPYDAKRMGFNPENLSYDRHYNTANGYGSGAKITLRELKLGEFKLRDIEASVNKQEMSTSLLGMAFLRQFRSYQVQDNILVLLP